MNFLDRKFLNQIKEPCLECGEKDCNSAPRFEGLSSEERMTLRQNELIAKTIVLLSKAVIAANQALDIDMGDDEATFQCCNSVCGHNCIIAQANDVAKTLTNLSQEDIKSFNKGRLYSGFYAPPIKMTEIQNETELDEE